MMIVAQRRSGVHPCTSPRGWSGWNGTRTRRMARMSAGKAVRPPGGRGVTAERRDCPAILPGTASPGLHEVGQSRYTRQGSKLRA